MPDLTITEALNLSPTLPRLDREVLLSHVIGQDRVFLMAHGETELTPAQLKRYRTLLTRATKHEPIAYIVGEKEFYGRKFFVGPGVLIPRPETELLVESTRKKILTAAYKKKKIAIVDVGTGSSAIITSIFLSLNSAWQKNISWFAVDSEAAALRYARKNARHHHVDKVRFIESDLLTKLSKRLSRYDEVFAIANLPYLSHALYQTTAPNVQHYEPKNALVSGEDGLDHYRRLLEELRTLSQAGVKVNFSFEVSPEQARKLPSLFKDIYTLSTLEILPDLAQKMRVVMGTLDPKQTA